MTDKDRLAGRFSFARPVVYQAPVFGPVAGGPAQSNFEGTGIQRTYSAGLNYTRVISNTLITDLRFGVAYYHNDRAHQLRQQRFVGSIGIPG